MLISVFSPKGGSGTTVSSVLFAKALMDFGHVTLVDAYNGDVEVVLGVDSPNQYCFSDWLHSPEPSAESLLQIATDVTPSLSCIRGSQSSSQRDTPVDVDQIVSVIQQLEGHCVIDLGTAHNVISHGVVDASDIVAMVLRPCFLALRAAMESPLAANVDVCVVVKEPGRTISTNQIAQSLGVPAVIEVEARRDFARAVDAGVLVHRTPDNLIKPFSRYVDDVASVPGVPSVPDVFTESALANRNDFWSQSSRQQFFTSKKSRDKIHVSRPYTQHARSVLRSRA